MLRHDRRARAESTSSAERVSERADDHVDGRGGNIVQLRQPTACASDGPDRERFVEDKPKLVLLLEFNL